MLPAPSDLCRQIETAEMVLRQRRFDAKVPTLEAPKEPSNGPAALARVHQAISEYIAAQRILVEEFAVQLASRE